MARTLPSLGAAKAAELEPAWREHTEAWARQRLLVIRLVAQHELSAERIAAAAGVNRSTVFRYLDNFQAGGVAQLLHRDYTGGKEPTLAGADHTAFVEQLRSGKFRRAKEAQAWIKQRTNRALALSSVYTLLGKAGGVLKVPRKTHAKKDAARTEAFKPELPARLDAATAEAGGRPGGSDPWSTRSPRCHRGWSQGRRTVAGPNPGDQTQWPLSAARWSVGR